jgi:Fe2+ or Zn2+ uptake regulation protein
MNRRYSIQKQAIMDALSQLDHPTVQAILGEVWKQYPRISKATVYRNLNLLVEDGVVKRLFLPGSPDRFDIDLYRHNHVYCAKCGQIFDLESDRMSNIDRQIERETGFAIETHSIIFQGVCPECKREGHK